MVKYQDFRHVLKSPFLITLRINVATAERRYSTLIYILNRLLHLDSIKQAVRGPVRLAVSPEVLGEKARHV